MVLVTMGNSGKQWYGGFNIRHNRHRRPLAHRVLRSGLKRKNRQEHQSAQ